jgi:hypothetical protein
MMRMALAEAREFQKAFLELINTLVQRFVTFIMLKQRCLLIKQQML